MSADVAQLMQMMQQDPSMAAPPGAVPTSGAVPADATGIPPQMDPTMTTPPVAPMPGAGMGATGQFPSTDPAMLAQVVQQALDQMATADTHQLEMQQQQAALSAQPLIDQMLQQAAMPQGQPMGDEPDPMQAYGQGGLPPMPPSDGAAF